MKGDYVSSVPPSMIESYLAYKKAEGVSAATLVIIRSHLKHWEEFAGNFVEFVVYLKLKGYSDQTIHTKKERVKAYLRWQSK